MSQDPRQLGAALAALVPPPPLRPARFEEVRARVTRRRRVAVVGAAGSVAGVVALVALGVHLLTAGSAATPTSGEPIAVTKPADARVAVHDARLTHPLTFDGGALRLDRASGTPAVSEEQALTLFRAGGMPYTQTDDVVITYAEATVSIPVDTNNESVVPHDLPTFTHRPVWAVLWDYNGPIYCGKNPPQVTGPVPRSVALIAADGTGEGIQYTTRGTPCGQPITGPTARILNYLQSLPWVVVSVAANGDATVQVTLPPCATLVGGNGPDSRGGATILAGVAMVRPPCTVTGHAARNTTIIPANGQPLDHGPTGLLPGRVSLFSGGNADTAFTYYDGTTHTIRDPAPTSTTATPTAEIAACPQGALQARMSGGGMGTGNDIVSITVWNTSGQPCHLTGDVRFAATDATGAPVTNARLGSAPRTVSVVLPANTPAPVTGQPLAAGQYLTAIVFGYERDDPNQPNGLCRTQDEITPATLTLGIGQLEFQVTNHDPGPADVKAAYGCHGKIRLEQIETSQG